MAARFVFPMSLSLDGYVAGVGGELEVMPAPGPDLFRHFLDMVRGLAGGVYGRRIYEVMRYWDDDQDTWNADQREFAAAWRAQRKWVVSRTLKTVGPGATLIEGDLEGAMRALKASIDGEVEVAGPELAQSLTELGLIDAYQLYFRPLVLGAGKPYFAGPAPPLRLAASERVGEDAIRLTYVPA